MTERIEENAKVLTTEGERGRISYVRLQSWQKRKAVMRARTQKTHLCKLELGNSALKTHVYRHFAEM